MKKITAITIKNYRGYFGEYAPITLANGGNLLIYGENGSGKSSLYKALKNYFSSSRNVTQPFIKSRYSPNDNGEIKLTFEDFDNTTGLNIPNSAQDHTFDSNHIVPNVPFIQNAALINGFLDYTDLLDVYLHKEARPNLFELIVLNLLGEHVPVRSGGNFKFRDKWSKLEADLLENCYTRNDWCHRIAKDELPIFETHLRSTLNQVFTELNRYLTDYFSDLGLQIRYDLLPIMFSYGNNYKGDWSVRSDLRLNVFKDGVAIVGDYSDVLNEARLSAFSICLYLAAIKQYSTLLDLRVVYLDDVFIGLDAGNRLPILRILQHEFSGYQLFISTYDRHWFELARRYFNNEQPNRWQVVELYVGIDQVNGSPITKPIVVTGETHFEKAVLFLHNRTKPDYPASANYFRKALEELISDSVPKWETVDAENTQLPDFALTQLVLRTKRFLERSNNNTSFVSPIIALLHNLLHPLSHHEISSPIYKNELRQIEYNFLRLKEQLSLLDIPASFRCCLESGKRILLEFEVDRANNHYCFYEIILKEPLMLIKNGNAVPLIADTLCHADRSFGHNGATNYPSSNYRKKDQNFNYSSLTNAYDRIYDFLINSPVGNFQKAGSVINSAKYHDGTNWCPLSNLIVAW